MKALLLPGLDGTGALHDDFCRALGLDCEVLRYPKNMVRYDDLCRHVAEHLPTDPFVIIAESFSGPLAIQIAASRPAKLRAIVFVASFAQAPRPAPAFAAKALQWMPMKSRLACQMMQPAVMGRWANRKFTTTLWAALKTVPAKTLAARLDQVLRVDETATFGAIDVPMLYLRATSDRLVPKAAARPFKASGASVQNIDGPHFLLQAQPDAAAAAIRSFVTALGVEAAPASD
ncbi:alpha/beta hydrolase [uncultured Litoreibacter sp.]|uniref:alpha/beta fold hydrolase n=1 Tax=uncultured Litoreibacter sp. TaxID=1392394 RepID=UPI002603C41B|nr:alpha/beta hydrolase [uncultured Litoreibacter sp.]